MQSKHPDLAKKPHLYFQIVREDMHEHVSALKNMVVEDNSLLNASNLIAHQIEENKKPHTIGDELVKPCMLQASEVVLGKQAVHKLTVIPMFANTVKRGIEEITEDIVNQAIKMAEIIMDST